MILLKESVIRQYSQDVGKGVAYSKDRFHRANILKIAGYCLPLCDMNKTLGKVLKYTLSIALAAVLVYFAVRDIDWESFLKGLKTTRWVWMVLYIVASVLGLVFRAQRWKQLLKPLDPNIRYGRCWDANNIGNLGSILIPGSCEPIRAGIITSKRVHFETVFGTMIMERGWDFLFIFITFLTAICLKWDTFGGFVRENIFSPLGNGGLFLWLILGLLLLIAAFVWASYHYRGKSKFFAQVSVIIDGLVMGLKSFGRLRNKFPFLVHTTMIWVMYMLMSYCCLQAIPELSGLDLADALFLSALGNIASVIPVPGGIGAYHYLIMLCLSSLYGFSNETGLLFAMLNHESHAILVLVLGAWSYVMRVIIMKNRDASAIRADLQKK